MTRPHRHRRLGRHRRRPLAPPTGWSPARTPTSPRDIRAASRAADVDAAPLGRTGDGVGLAAQPRRLARDHTRRRHRRRRHLRPQRVPRRDRLRRPRPRQARDLREADRPHVGWPLGTWRSPPPKPTRRPGVLLLPHRGRRSAGLASSLDSGELGAVAHFRGWMLPGLRRQPRPRPRLAGPPGRVGCRRLGDLGSHIIDIARYLCGEITGVSASTRELVDRTSRRRASTTS